MISDPLLEIRDLSVCFTSDQQERQVVDHISFELKVGETLAVVGESGSGKTVTALAVLRLIPSPPVNISSGEIFFRQDDGTKADILCFNERAMQKLRGDRISMIFQEPMTSLNPVFTCGDQVMEGLGHHLQMKKRQAREKVLELFGEVKLPRPAEIFKAYPHQLSGGQKQRVMIAMAIACNPAILIADEPTTALDVTVQKTILELLKNLQVTRKMSILFITHDLGLVAGFADRVLVMYKGSIVEQGDVAGIFQSPQHAYTRGLLACRPPLHDRPVRLPTIENYLNAEQNARILDRINHESVKIYYDCFNTGATKGYDVPKELRFLQGRVAQIHFKNGPAYLEDGKVKFPPIAEAIKAIGYSGWIVLETSAPSKNKVTDAKRNADYIRKLFA